MADPLLRLIDISKSYPGVRALSRVSLTVNRGEVLALIGENGAGKSTLMKILGGVVKPDQGTIEIDGAPHSSLTVSESLSSGIAFVHQELNLFDNLDVGANVLIGREPLSAGPLKLVDRKTTKRIVAPLLKRLDVDFEVDDLVSDLSLAQRQLLEIAKALSLNARVVIMDEPTSSLTSTETDRLMRVIGELKADGVSIIFITHRLNEVETCADRVVVLRDGSVVGELARDADPSRRHDPPHDRARPQVALHPAQITARRERAGGRGLTNRFASRARREPFAEGGRDSGHGRIDRSGANRARARCVRH